MPTEVDEVKCSNCKQLRSELIAALNDASEWRHEYALAMKGQEEIRLKTIEDSLIGVEKLQAKLAHMTEMDAINQRELLDVTKERDSAMKVLREANVLLGSTVTQGDTLLEALRAIQPDEQWCIWMRDCIKAQEALVGIVRAALTPAPAEEGKRDGFCPAKLPHREAHTIPRGERVCKPCGFVLPAPEPKPEKGIGHPFVACACPLFCKYANREGCHEWNKIRGHICSAPASEHQARVEEPEECAKFRGRACDCAEKVEEPELHCWCSRPFPCAEHPPEPELLAPPVIRRVEEPTRELLLGHEFNGHGTANWCRWFYSDGTPCGATRAAHYSEGSK